MKTMTIGFAAFAAMVIVLASAGAASAGPAEVNPTGTARGDIVAVSVLGNAHCTTETCVAVTVTGDAKAGCSAWSNCRGSIDRCDGLACAVVGVSVVGRGYAYTYCDYFGQTCYAASSGLNLPSTYFCYGDVANAGNCRGVL